MVSRVVVVRELVAAVFFLLFLALFRPDPTPTPSDLSVVNDTSSDLSTAALLAVKTLLDDPVRFHALVAELDDARPAYYNDDDFDFPSIPSLAMSIEPTVVSDVPLAHATVFVPPRHRPSTHFMDRVLGAQVGPPTSTSSSDVPVPVVTAPPPSSRPRPFPILSPVKLDTVFAVLALVAVSLLASLVYLRRLAKITKAFSPSPLPAIPAATEPTVPSAIEPLPRPPTVQPSSLIDPSAAIVDVPSSPVVPSSHTASRHPPSPQAKIIYQTSAPRSRASIASHGPGSIIYQTTLPRPSSLHSSVAAPTPAHSVFHNTTTRPIPGAIIYETPRAQRSHISYQTPVTASRPTPLPRDPRLPPVSPDLIWSTPSWTSICREPSSASSQQSRAPPPSAHGIYSTGNTTGKGMSVFPYQNSALASSPRVLDSTSTISHRQYEAFVTRPRRAPPPKSCFCLAPPVHICPQEVGVWEIQHHHHRDLSRQRVLRVREAQSRW
ncbi:hypothetical protein C8R46DRAFT_1325402 [Mycena filopes]|nr:hypothetical protein C8R46DRAFT_1325402 [Mycena filopes]